LGFVVGGELYVLGRLDDLLIVNGRNCHAHEIEAIVDDLGITKPGRCVAFAWWNQQARNNNLIVVAESKEATDIDPDEIVERITLRILSTVNVQPREVRLVSPGWLIKTTSGKISRGANSRKYLGEREVTAGRAYA
jgi:fatty-acyl-CoA synthase